MWKLLQKECLLVHEHFDYQGVCVPEPEVMSAGFRSVVPPAIFELLTLKWWSAKVAWAYWNFNMYQWWNSMFGGSNTQGNYIVKDTISNLKY
jgi:hypothetical protein